MRTRSEHSREALIWGAWMFTLLPLSAAPFACGPHKSQGRPWPRLQAQILDMPLLFPLIKTPLTEVGR